jgi:hypothetical protein
MTTREKRISLKKTARIAGILILIMSPFAVFSMMYVPSSIIVPGDAWATASNIMASEVLFRLGIVSDSVVFLLEIVIVVMLYVLLKPVNKTLSLVAAFSRLAMTVIQGINLLNNITALLLLSGADYLTVFEAGQLNSLVLLFLNTHEYVAHIWGLFFSLHLFFLGYLVYKSGYIPRILGIVLVIASVSYLIQSWGNILLPKYEEILAWIGFLSIIEIAFPIWLVIRGVKDKQPASRSAG